MTIFNWQHQPRWTLTTSFSWSYLLWYHAVYLPVNHFWDIFSPQSHLFFSKQRGGLDEVGHVVEQQLLSPTDRWSKWEKQMYNQDIARARLCQDMPLARSEAGIELRRTWAALRTDEVGLRWINCKGRLWGNQPLNKEVGSRNSPKNLRESHCAHKGEEWGLTSLSLLSPLSLLNPGLRTTNTAWGSFQQQPLLPWCCLPKQHLFLHALVQAALWTILGFSERRERSFNSLRRKILKYYLSNNIVYK